MMSDKEQRPEKKLGDKVKEFINPNNNGTDYKEFTDRVGDNIKSFGESPWKHEQEKGFVCRKERLGNIFNCECPKCEGKKGG